MNVIEEFLGVGFGVLPECLEKNVSFLAHNGVPLSEDAWSEEVVERSTIIPPQLAVSHDSKAPFEVHPVNNAIIVG
jgi:hypothetical protein